jgi:hypothetical protein
MIVVVGSMMVPLAERSTTGWGVDGRFLAAAAGIALAARTATQKTAPVSGRTTKDKVPRCRCHQSSLICRPATAP